jgi:hypothetical protein
MSFGYRSKIERDTLKVEAERRVREGEARANVAQSLGVAQSTLAQWACAGGWRLKDIETEKADELAETAARRVADGLARDAARRMAEEDARRRAADAHAALLASDPNTSYRKRVAANLDRLIERLEREKREKREAEAKAAAEAASGPSPDASPDPSSGPREAPQGLGRLAEGAEEGAAHAFGIAEAGVVGDGVDRLG